MVNIIYINEDINEIINEGKLAEWGPSWEFQVDLLLHENGKMNHPRELIRFRNKEGHSGEAGMRLPLLMVAQKFPQNNHPYLLVSTADQSDNESLYTDIDEALNKGPSNYSLCYAWYTYRVSQKKEKVNKILHKIFVIAF